MSSGPPTRAAGLRIPFNRVALQGKELAYIGEAVERGHLSGDGDFTRRCSEWLEAAIGAERVGIRISPAHNIQGVLEEDAADTRATYEALVDGIADLGLAYLSILADPSAELTQDLRRRFGGPVVLNSGFSEQTTVEEVEKLLADDLADLVAVGRPFLANPDLAERWRRGAALNEPDPATFYGGGAEGYTDYPTLAGS